MNSIFILIKLIFKNFSLLRIFQILEFQKIEIRGKTLEFGAVKNLKRNFTNYSKNKIDTDYSNIVVDRNSNIFYADLTKKLKIKHKRYNNVLIFNVLEHLDKYDLAFSEINRILINNGKLVGSTPFIYQIHGAPKDYFRFTKDFLYLQLKKNNFKNIEIKSLGFGPFVASYNLLQSYLKYLPIFNQFILFFCYIFDKFIQLFVKTNLKEIYPIGFIFLAKKK